MESDNIEEVLQQFREISMDNNDSIFEKYADQFWAYPPSAPREPQAHSPAEAKYVDWEKYIEEKCENRIQILNRSTFHQIKRPILIAFNHFREKCFYLTKWLDRLYEVSLKYGDQIEFIVADQIDMDLLYPSSNPLNFFSYLDWPETEGLSVYAIDKRKRIYEHERKRIYEPLYAYNTEEILSELCEKLLNGSLYISQDIPKEKQTLVKICVHLNYEEIVEKSTKNILLIIGWGDYCPHNEYEPDYEELSEKLKDSNLDVVYIDGDQNYIPLKFNAKGYPTIIFILHNDKDSFVHCNKRPQNIENLIEFVKENIVPQAESWRRMELSKYKYKPFHLPFDKDLKFDDLNKYISENFPNSLKVLDRQTFSITGNGSIIHFMDFKRNGVAFYLQTLQNIYQVVEAEHYSGVEYLIADIKDMDFMYPKWYGKYLEDLEMDSNIPQVFAIDRLKFTYKLEDVKTAASLFYHSVRLIYSHGFYSQPWATSTTNKDVVTICVAHNLKFYIKKSKKDIFLTIYWGNYKGSVGILKVLNEIAQESAEQNVDIVKMDAKLNLVPLEYIYPKYPVHFFIPQRKKEEETVRFVSSSQSKEELLEFIRTNVQR